ncbi:hypothetical protein PIB30_062332 [Stylosanthes scabra]|uniref:DUF4283 domain-containing protein n=1 Tax=Stylosanthes scabra TaxID=79078 RepID=A0ABU6UK51_9FABA|nr:hypothetical protein [Stylosanthes scabra]
MAASAQIPTDCEIQEDVEEHLVTFEEEDIREGVESCSKSLIGKLLSDRSFSAGILEIALQAIWRQTEGFRVPHHGGNIFQFFFNIERWNEDLEIKETEFINVPLWIQLWGVPEHCKTKSLAVKVESP